WKGKKLPCKIEGKRAKIGRESRLSNRRLYPDELGVDIKQRNLIFFYQPRG
ncbi:hypothetical protein Gotur_002676, partial [Gossypium turneri]